jgi:HSP20 family molecular chaperone IbpA
MINYNLEDIFLKDGGLRTDVSTSRWQYFSLNNDKKGFAKQLQFAGYDKDEISVSYENDYLTVDANSSMLNSQYTKKYYLPSEYYDVDNITVKFEKCILNIECKLKEERESKVMKITIK